MSQSEHWMDSLSPRRADALGGTTTFLLLVASVAFASVSAHAAQATDTYNALVEEKAQALLKDLSSRRRVAKLFRNHQSMFHGVQERFVNTSAGNLTFLVRDLVAMGGMPNRCRTGVRLSIAKG